MTRRRRQQRPNRRPRKGAMKGLALKLSQLKPKGRSRGNRRVRPRQDSGQPSSGGRRLAHTLTRLFLPLIVAATAFLLPVLSADAYHLVMQGDHFRVHEVEITQVVGRSAIPDALMPRSDKPAQLSHHDILALIGVDGETQLVEADLDAMRDKLSRNPWVRWARVARELPDRLVIHLIEHEPLAYLAADSLYLVNEIGQPFMKAPANAPLDLPVISGLDPELLTRKAGRIQAATEIRTALNILQIWSTSGLDTRFPIGELHLEPAGSVKLVLEQEATGHATEIALGTAPFRDKLLRAEWVLEHLRSVGQKADYMLLDLGDLGDPMGAPTLQVGGARVIVKTELSDDQPLPAGRRQDPTTDAAPTAPDTADPTHPEAPLPEPHPSADGIGPQE